LLPKLANKLRDPTASFFVVSDTDHEIRRAKGYDLGSKPTAFGGQFAVRAMHWTQERDIPSDSRPARGGEHGRVAH
jgi:hypothetical protein